MIKFKDDRDMKLFFLMHPLLQLILTDGAFWAYKRNLNFVITETVTTLKDDRKYKRKSSSHRQNRAADVRSRGWGKENIKAFENYLEGKFGEYGALVKNKGLNLVEHHNSGHGPHFHIQLHSKFKL